MYALVEQIKEKGVKIHVPFSEVWDMNPWE
jgi:hypothetical protein